MNGNDIKFGIINEAATTNDYDTEIELRVNGEMLKIAYPSVHFEEFKTEQILNGSTLTLEGSVSINKRKMIFM